MRYVVGWPIEKNLPVWSFIYEDYGPLPGILTVFIEFAHLFRDLERVYA